MDDLAVKRLLQADIDNVLHTLSPRECGVLRMRYGLDDGEEKTLEEIGLRYKVRRLQRLSRGTDNSGRGVERHSTEVREWVQVWGRIPDSTRFLGDGCAEHRHT